MGDLGLAAGVGRGAARRAVVSIVAFWLLGGLGSLNPWGLGFVPVLVALPCGFVFFYTVSEIAAEGTAWRPLDYWNIPGFGKAPPAEKRKASNALFRRSWWARIVNSAAWPPALVWSVLVAALAVAVLGIWQRFEPLFRNT